MQNKNITKVNTGEALERLAQFVKLKTESFTDYDKFDMKLFKKVDPLLKKLYPKAFKVLETIAVGELACLYRWKGKDPDLQPDLLMAHYDVVGARDEEWTHPPFAGVIEDDVLWGRGTLDCKGSLAAPLEAVNNLAAEGYQPERDFYFAFGGDEEVAGTHGAGKISDYLESEGLSFRYVLDEGGAVTEGMLGAITEKPVALVGVAEKGMCSLRLICKGQSGHSSSPPAHTAIGKLARAIAVLENNPFPLRMDRSVTAFLKALAPHAKQPMKAFFQMLPLTKGIVMKGFSKSSATAPMVRTTQAVTTINGGTRENVLPDRVEAVVNYRILPGETIQSIIARVKGLLVGMDVEVVEFEGWPSNDPISAPQGEATEELKMLLGLIEEVFPGTAAVPYLMTAATDSKYYYKVSKNIFRFAPMKANAETFKTIHGVDEKISRSDYADMVRFYHNLLQL